MGKISISKRQSPLRISRKEQNYPLSDVSSVDSNSDSGLDVGGHDCESRDDMGHDEPSGIFKNPSISSYEDAMDKLLFPNLQISESSEHSEQEEPPSKKLRIGTTQNRMHKVSNRLSQNSHGFGIQSSLMSNYADLVLEEANLGCPRHDMHQLPHLQTVLKTIFREEGCTPPPDLATQHKSETSSGKSSGAVVTSSTDSIVSSRANSVTSSVGTARRIPVGRRHQTLSTNFPAKIKGGKVELRILAQPEEQHRARYLTEGSRGAVKDRHGSGYPTVKLFGYYKPVTLQIFIGCDQGKVQPHLFYQASKVCGKNSAPCSSKKIEGTVVLELTLLPEKDMTLSCDCVGILKERNVDVEQRVLHFGGARNKKRSTKCRLVFRALLAPGDGSEEILQVVSASIVCTQPPGIPEICRKSITECSAVGNSELFIIGKNFLKDTKVVFEEYLGDSSDDSSLPSHADMWKKVVNPEKDFLQPNHLICNVPPYHDIYIGHPVRVRLLVQSSGKRSEPQNFTYLPVANACCSHGIPQATTGNESDLRFVQQDKISSKGTNSLDMLPALLPLSLAQQNSMTNSSHDNSQHFKQEDRDSHQTMITAVMIPATSEGGSSSLLSPATTAQIIQDNQDLICRAASSESAGAVIRRPIKTSHIQVLVMPASTTVSVTTASEVKSVNSSQHSLKLEVPRDALSNCNSQDSQLLTQTGMHLREMVNPESVCSAQGRQFLESNFSQRSLTGVNSNFATLGKEPQCVRDLLLQGTSENEATKNTISLNQLVHLNKKSAEISQENMSLEKSLQDNLGSLESIPLQSLIQASGNAELNVLQPISQFNQVNSLTDHGFSGGKLIQNSHSQNINQNLSELASILDKTRNTSFVYHLRPRVGGKIQKTGGVAVSSATRYDNPVSTIDVVNQTTLLPVCNPAQEDQQRLCPDGLPLSNSTSFNPAVNSYFGNQADLLRDQTSTSASDHNPQFISNSNPMLGIAFPKSNLTHSEGPSENIQQISLSPENHFQTITENTLQSLGKVISLPESQILNFTENFQNFESNPTMTSTVLTPSTAQSINFQDFKLEQPNASAPTLTTDRTPFTFHQSLFEKNLHCNSKNLSDTIDPTFIEASSGNDLMSKADLVSTMNMSVPDSSLTLKQNFMDDSAQRDMSSIADTQTQMNVQMLNSLSENSCQLDFQDHNKISSTPLFLENRSVNVDFTNIQPSLIIAGNQFSSMSSVEGVQEMDIDIPSSSAVVDPDNTVLNSIVIPEALSVPSEVATTNRITQEELGTTSFQQIPVTITLASQESKAPTNSNISTNVQPTGPSVEQVSAMLTLMNDNDLFKFINNPNTFDKL